MPARDSTAVKIYQPGEWAAAHYGHKKAYS